MCKHWANNVCVCKHLTYLVALVPNKSDAGGFIECRVAGIEWATHLILVCEDPWDFRHDIGTYCDVDCHRGSLNDYHIPIVIRWLWSSNIDHIRWNWGREVEGKIRKSNSLLEHSPINVYVPFKSVLWDGSVSHRTTTARPCHYMQSQLLKVAWAFTAQKY